MALNILLIQEQKKFGTMESDQDLILQIEQENEVMAELLSAKEEQHHRMSAECNYYEGLCLTSLKVLSSQLQCKAS